MSRSLPLLYTAGLAVLLVVAGCDAAQTPSMSEADLAPETAAGQYGGTIADIAVGNPDFSTLVAALSCTNLVGAVSSNRQLTVFAPDNNAFGDLGLNAGNICETFETEVLAGILLYHVVPGRRTANSVLPAGPRPRSLVTLNGASISVSGNGMINVDQAQITAPDILARNGVIHVIDGVLLP